MRKIKNILLLLGVALIVATPLSVFLPQSQGIAFAENPPGNGLQWTEAPAKFATGSWWDDATIAERVDMYVYMNAIAFCASYNFDRGVTTKDIAEGEIFGNKSGQKDSNVQIGAYANLKEKDGGDGVLSCSGDEGILLVQAFAQQLWNSGIITDVTGDGSLEGSFIGLTCYLGWVPDSGSGPDPSDCAKNTGGGLTVPSGDAVMKKLSQDLAGVTTDRAYNLLGGPEQYHLYNQTLMRACVTANGSEISRLSDATTDQLALAQNGQEDGDSQYYIVSVVTGDGATDQIIYDGVNKRETDKLLPRINPNGSKIELKCSEIEKEANKRVSEALDYFKANPQLAATLVNAGTGPNGEYSNGSPFNADEAALDLDCGGFELTNIFSLDWVFCPMVQGIMSLAGRLENSIAGALCVSESDIFGANSDTCPDSNKAAAGSADAFYDAWSIFRGIALGILVIGGLIMIVAQGLGFEVFDAYTVKRTLPRILVAAIGVTLSWPVMEFLVTASNVLGLGIRNIIYAPFAGIGTQSALSGGEGWLVLLFGAGSFVALGALGLLSFLATAALAILIAFIILALREVLIVFLILVAPVAIVLYILPNTEGIFKSWWSWFTKALLAFPIITGMIAMGHVFAAITFQADGSAFTTFIAFAAYFGPYFLIPAAFRFAGGALATIGGFANDRSRGGFDRLKKFRQGRSARNLERAANYSRFSERSRVGRGLNTAIGTVANPTSVLGGSAGIAARRASNQSIQGAEWLKDNKVFQANQNDDNFLMALANRDLAEQKLNEAKSKLSTETNADKQNKLRAEIDAREKGLASAGQMDWFQRENRSTRMAALDALTKTGYQFSEGTEGYKELDSTVRSIVGGDEQGRVQMMDQAQYNLRASGGRFDLGGINHGQGFDLQTGLNKGSLYELANGKSESIRQLGSGAGAGPVGKSHAIAYKELEAMLPNTKGANRDAVVSEMDKLESRGIKEYIATRTTEQQVVKYSARERARGIDTGNPWTPAEMAQGYRHEARSTTLGEQAGREARAYERPDPNRDR